MATITETAISVEIPVKTMTIIAQNEGLLVAGEYVNGDSPPSGDRGSVAHSDHNPRWNTITVLAEPG